MKIYIEQETASSFLALAKDNKNNAKIVKILQKIDKYLINKQTINEIYSKEGIYQINENQTYKLYVKSEKIHENIVLKANNDKIMNLVFDDSIIEKNLVHQIPYDHISIPLTIHTYSLNNNDKLGMLLVVEFIQNKNIKDYVKPINYYFEYKAENGYNNLPLEDINVFLSLLN
jgi:hypothetical protein